MDQAAVANLAVTSDNLLQEEPAANIERQYH